MKVWPSSRLGSAPAGGQRSERLRARAPYNPERLQALPSDGTNIAGYPAPPLMHDCVGSPGRGRAIAREATRPTRASPIPIPALDGVVAIVGCDGTGKTTLVADLVTSLRRRRPTERRYMGLVSGETGDKIKRLPFIGIRLERHLAAKVRRAQDMEKKLPGTFSAIVMYLFSLWRVLKLRRLIRLSEKGVLVIAERYPQAEIPGFHYDGPGLTIDRTSNWLIRKLAMREQKLYDWMAEQRPALIIRLNIDEDTAYARKPDHPIAEFRDKIAKIPRIKYNGAEVCEIDSLMPYPQVVEAATQAINVVMGGL